jgi:uncharacterized protein (DUF849 family)
MQARKSIDDHSPPGNSSGPPGKRNGPDSDPGRSPAAPTTRASVQRRPGAAGELAAWGAAVVHLHALGLPAAVPEFPAAWLRRRGVRADWTAAA